MFSNKLAVAIKHSGKVLRENKDSVYLPFGSEYSIFIKNLNSVRAIVKVEIDGQDVADGTRFIVNANDTLDLERFLKNGNQKKGNRFKFIERTGSVEQHRGVQLEDGIVRVEFQFEKRAPKVEYQDVYIKRHYYDDYWDYYRRYPRPYWYWDGGSFYGSSVGMSSSGGLQNASSTKVTLSASNNSPVSNNVSIPTGAAGGGISGAEGSSTICYVANAFTQTCDAFVSTTSTKASAPVNDAGITVAGSVSDQEFSTGGWFPTETESYSIVLKLFGENTKGKKVEQAVTVTKKTTCSVCGTRNRGQNKFCRNCGASLEIV